MPSLLTAINANIPRKIYSILQNLSKADNRKSPQINLKETIPESGN